MDDLAPGYYWVRGDTKGPQVPGLWDGKEWHFIDISQRKALKNLVAGISSGAITSDWDETFDNATRDANRALKTPNPLEIRVISPIKYDHPKPGYISLSFDYWEEEDWFIVYDFYGYVCTAISENDLWKAIIYEHENGVGSLRKLSKVEAKPPVATPDYQYIREKFKQLDAARRWRQKAQDDPDNIDLDELDLDL